MRCLGHVAHVDEKRNVYSVVMGKPEGMRQFRQFSYISFRYAVNGPTKLQEVLANHEAEYFRQSQASLLWPITAAAIIYKKALADNFWPPDGGAGNG